MNRIVERAISRSQLQKIARLQIKSDWSPSIAISRDPGSGGQLIAEKVAKKLRWKVVDKTYMKRLASELNISASEFLHVDEHSRSWIADFLNTIFNPAYVSDIRYITHLKALLRHAAKKHNLVILGHGANLILPKAKCLRVRITASLTTRINSTYKFEHKSSQREAREWVEHIQRQRDQFIRQYFGVNPHNPWNYDLTISTDNLSLDQATQLIMHAFFIKFPSERRRLKAYAI